MKYKVTIQEVVYKRPKGEDKKRQFHGKSKSFVIESNGGLEKIKRRLASFLGVKTK